MDDRPIGVFDSGLGGISILRRAMRVLPQERFIYYGDNHNAPYGCREVDEIYTLTLDAVNKLYRMGVKAILVACNTATAAAIEDIKTQIPLPIVGTAPAIARAEAQTGAGLILSFATEATMKLPYYKQLRAKLTQPDRLKDIPGPAEIVRRIENGLFSPSGYDDILGALFAPYRGKAVGGVVLGCTHYPFIVDEISRHFTGAKPRFYDGGVEAVDSLARLLDDREIRAHAGRPDREARFVTSGDDAVFRPLFQKMMECRLVL